MSVDWIELLNTFEFVSLGQPGEHEAVLCRKTGKFLWHTELEEDLEMWPDDADDGKKYLAIPHKKELDLGKPLVFAFAEEFLPDEFDEIRRMFEKRAPMRGSRISCNEGRPSISGSISRPGRLKRPCGNGAKTTKSRSSP